MTEHRGHRVRIVRVFAESVILRDRFRLRVDDKFIGIAAARFAIQRRSPLAKNLFQLFLWNGGDLLDGFDAEGTERALRDFADAWNFSNRKWRKKPFFAAGRNPHQTARLGLVRCNFRNQPRRGESTGTRQLRCARDRSKQLVGGDERWAMQAFGAREIEIGFINLNHFDDRRKFSEDGCDAVAPLRIFFVVAVQKNCVRAKPPRRSERHRGVNPECPRFITRGGDDTALIGTASHDNWFAAKLRPFQQFHRNEKRVHVHVQDGRLRERRLILEWAVLGSKAREFRHAP